SLALLFRHQDPNHTNNLHPWFEGDVITGQMRVTLKTDITQFVASYGVADWLDAGVAVPISHISLDARVDAQIQRLSTAHNAPGIHRFPDGGSTTTFRPSGTKTGIGDVTLRAKARLADMPMGGAALLVDVRLPTGDEDNLLGTGHTQVRGLAIGSLRFDTF